LSILFRWLFILEGLTTCVIAAICYFFIPDSPAAAKWLTTEEARFIELRLQFDGHESGYKESDFQWKYLKQGFSDAKVWMGTVSYLRSHSPPTRTLLEPAYP
jgi:hypothetical protein